MIDMRDAGPRRSVRERLRRSEGSLRAVLEGLPDATVASARDGRIVFVNEFAEELFGYRRDQLVGRPVQMLWPERMRERYRRNMQLYFATEHPLRFTERAYGLRADGTEFVGEMSWGIVRTDDGPAAAGRRARHHRPAGRRAPAAPPVRAADAVAELSELALSGADACELCRSAAPAVGQAISADRVEIQRGGEQIAAWGVAVSRHRPGRVRDPRGRRAVRHADRVPVALEGSASRTRRSCARSSTCSPPRSSGWGATSGPATRRCTTR